MTSKAFSRRYRKNHPILVVNLPSSSHLFYGNRLIKTDPANPERVKSLFACAIRRAWMIAPLAQFSLSNRIELSHKYSSSRYLVTGFRVSGYPGLMCRKTVTFFRDYHDILHRRVTVGSQPNTLLPHHSKASTRETRELFLALTRRRTDSLSSENHKTLFGLDLRL